MDLDMLISDFYVLTTSSRRGSRYHDLFSHSNGEKPRFPFAPDIID